MCGLLSGACSVAACRREGGGRPRGLSARRPEETKPSIHGNQIGVQAAPVGCGAGHHARAAGAAMVTLGCGSRLKKKGSAAQLQHHEPGVFASRNTAPIPEEATVPTTCLTKCPVYSVARVLFRQWSTQLRAVLTMVCTAACRQDGEIFCSKMGVIGDTEVDFHYLPVHCSPCLLYKRPSLLQDLHDIQTGIEWWRLLHGWKRNIMFCNRA